MDEKLMVNETQKRSKPKPEGYISLMRKSPPPLKERMKYMVIRMKKVKEVNMMNSKGTELLVRSVELYTVTNDIQLNNKHRGFFLTKHR